MIDEALLLHELQEGREVRQVDPAPLQPLFQDVSDPGRDLAASHQDLIPHDHQGHSPLLLRHLEVLERFPEDVAGPALTGVEPQDQELLSKLVLEGEEVIGDDLVAVGAGGGIEENRMDDRLRLLGPPGQGPETGQHTEKRKDVPKTHGSVAVCRHLITRFSKLEIGHSGSPSRQLDKPRPEGPGCGCRMGLPPKPGMMLHRHRERQPGG